MSLSVSPERHRRARPRTEEERKPRRFDLPPQRENRAPLKERKTTLHVFRVRSQEMSELRWSIGKPKEKISQPLRKFPASTEVKE
jgi:hypothetical protein